MGTIVIDFWNQKRSKNPWGLFFTSLQDWRGPCIRLNNYRTESRRWQMWRHRSFIWTVLEKRLSFLNGTSQIISKILQSMIILKLKFKLDQTDFHPIGSNIQIKSSNAFGNWTKQRDIKNWDTSSILIESLSSMMTLSGNFQVQLLIKSGHSWWIFILTLILKVSFTSSLVKDLLQKENFSMEIFEKIFNQSFENIFAFDDLSCGANWFKISFIWYCIKYSCYWLVKCMLEGTDFKIIIFTQVYPLVLACNWS